MASAGKAWAKHRIAQLVTPDPALLPYRPAVLAYMAVARREGRTVILATGADHAVAQRVSGHLGGFTAVLASDGKTNLSGGNKLAAIRQHCGSDPFDYVGNDFVDLPIWAESRRAIVVAPSGRLLRRARSVAPVTEVVGARKPSADAWFAAARPRRWGWNVLVFVPLLLSDQLPGRLAPSALAFAAFGLMSSSMALAHDLLTLESHRRDLPEGANPFAAGTLDLRVAVFLMALLTGFAFALGAVTLPPAFLIALAGFGVLALAGRVRPLGVWLMIPVGLGIARLAGGFLAIGFPP